MIKKRYVSKQSMLIYKELLTNIALNKRARQEAGEYEGFNVGKAVILEKYVDDSLILDLTVLTKKDGYNFSSHYIQKAYDGNVTNANKIIFSTNIQNEKLKNPV